MNFPKIFGWLLLLVGLAIIIWTLYSSYNIFTGKSLAPEIFKFEKKETQTTNPTEEGIPTSFSEIQAGIKKLIGEELKGMIPVDFLSKILNLIAWTIFAGISIFAGSKISGLGIKLIKKQ